MPDLAPTEIARALEMRRNGQTYRVISRDLCRTVSTIHRSIQRFRETGTYVRRAGQGRKRHTSCRDDRFIRLRVHRHPRLTAFKARHESEAVRGVTVSERTVRRRFSEAGLGSFVPTKAPRLEVNHRRNRLTFAQEHRLWNADQWSKI
ncbi:jg11867 [Pararge aegeria aegeria]|uniref:Jg11867 protein n=1 Tax=Pararge aegeria aegeria TaxID=348720 RepID=A0A8S4SMG6_9NEOP|nr:jg11867 [Pararge aegeria aegeria]